MKKLRRAVSALLMLAICAMLCSCATESLLSNLGFDTHDYASEPTLTVCDADSETGQSIAAMLRILYVDSPYLTSFKGVGDAVELYKDSVLNYMVSYDYAKYTGTSLIDEASKAYPHMTITTMIPAEDFENTMYTYFGGSEKIINSNGRIFSYLDKVDGYTPVTKPQTTRVVTEIRSIEETENTYRVVFVNRLDDEISPEYFTVIIKRDDGTAYFSVLRENRK
jgi:hypothetical protein